MKKLLTILMLLIAFTATQIQAQFIEPIVIDLGIDVETGFSKKAVARTFLIEMQPNDTLGVDTTQQTITVYYKYYFFNGEIEIAALRSEPKEPIRLLQGTDGFRDFKKDFGTVFNPKLEAAIRLKEGVE